jgi:hypothetical protein
MSNLPSFPSDVLKSNFPGIFLEIGWISRHWHRPRRFCCLSLFYAATYRLMPVVLEMEHIHHHATLMPPSLHTTDSTIPTSETLAAKLPASCFLSFKFTGSDKTLL